jgi:hypothetical protein
VRRRFARAAARERLESRPAAVAAEEAMRRRGEEATQGGGAKVEDQSDARWRRGGDWRGRRRSRVW